MPKEKYASKADRFKGLAEKRTNRIIESLRILSHCSNKSLYEYREEDVDKIFSAITSALEEAKLSFKNKKRERFKL